jgi:predicted nuclease with TOPRIM domain
MNKKQMETKLQELQQQVNELLSRNNADLPQNLSVEGWLRYFAEQRDRTNMILASVVDQMRVLQDTVAEMTGAEGEAEQYDAQRDETLDLSPADVRILNFIQTQPQGMACADDVRKYMGYRGNNAACARMNRLRMMGLLETHRLGHRVYYAGKATMKLIVSPPQ